MVRGLEWVAGFGQPVSQLLDLQVPPACNAATTPGATATAQPSDVPITWARRFGWSCEVAGQHSVQSSVDNCHADKAVTNAKQLADLLNRSDLVGVVKPG
jgi:hypothetical protein